MACVLHVDRSWDRLVRSAHLPLTSRKAQGSGWPNKPIRIIVPGGPGGVTDIRARWLGERLGPALGQLVVVENRPGAGGNLGTAAAARSAADGYTLVIVHIGTMGAYSGGANICDSTT